MPIVKVLFHKDNMLLLDYLDAEDWRFNSDIIKDYEKHRSDLNVRYIIWFYQKRKEDLESKIMQEYNKLSNQVHYIIAVNNKEIEIGRFTYAALINKLIEMAYDPIEDIEDDGVMLQF
ncbi:hypothetical protein L0F63_002295 [Massospora cicadina]|nr:hypothetical protein L0F63_002295 [Massospora cicadina]